MRNAFTLIELMIVIAIIAIIAAIAIPNIMENKKEKVNGVEISYRDLVGKTFIWNGNKVLVTDYTPTEYRMIYKIVILNKNQSVAVEADKNVLFEAYKDYLRNPKSIEIE